MTAAGAALAIAVTFAQAAPRGEVSPAGGPGDEPPSRAEPAGAPHRGVAPAALSLALLRALEAADPPVDELRAAASALALTEPDRARSLVDRARHAGWLPTLQLRADRRLARGESVDLGPSITTPLAPVGIDSDNDVRYEARASWDLSRIVFNPDEIGAQFQALRAADARREVELLVVRLYFERRRLKAESAAADVTNMARIKLELRAAEIEAELDALTGGAFSRRVRPAAAGVATPRP
jgi:hypothetical protein